MEKKLSKAFYQAIEKLEKKRSIKVDLGEVTDTLKDYLETLIAQAEYGLLDEPEHIKYLEGIRDTIILFSNKDWETGVI